MTKQQKTQQQAFQTVEEQNNGKLALLHDEIHLCAQNVERIKEDTYKHISYMLELIYSLEDAFRCYQFESAYCHLLQSSQLHLSQIGLLYTQSKAFRTPFYAYRKYFFFIFFFISRYWTYHTTILLSYYNPARAGCWRISKRQQFDTSYTIGIRSPLLWTTNSIRSHDVTSRYILWPWYSDELKIRYL